MSVVERTPAAAHHPGGLSDLGLRRRMFRNAAALVVGRNLVSLGRLVIAALVVRFLGQTVFGEYALIVVWLTIAEWILDFGTTEVFVREANQAPQRRERLLRIFLGLKFVQAPIAILVLTLGLLAMGYPGRVVNAGLLASISLIFLAGVDVCRASFKASLTMEREVIAEFVSVLAMMAFLLLLPRLDLGLMGLMGAWALSRGVFLLGCAFLARGSVPFSARDVSVGDLRWAATSSFAIGVIGFLVVLHNAMDLLILSRLASIEDVAIYSAAQRFTLPLMMGMNAVAVSLYPVLAVLDSPERFRDMCRRAVNTSFLLSGAAVVGLWCGAEFLMGLLSQDFVPGSGALRILAVMFAVKALALVIGPVLFLVNAQNQALTYMAAAVVAKMVVLGLVIPRFGYIGAAAGTLAVEAFFLAPVTLFMVYRYTGFRVRVADVVRIVAVVAGVILLTRAIMPLGGFMAALTGCSLYAAAALVTGVVKPGELRALAVRNAR